MYPGLDKVDSPARDDDAMDESDSPNPPSSPDDPTYSPSGSSSDSEDQMEPQEEVIHAFIAHVRQFLTQRADDVQQAYDSDAGWEQWLHVELYRHVTAANDMTITREPAAYQYNTRLRADFRIDTQAETAPVPVEIKCETARETAAGFTARSKIDDVKLDQHGGWALVFAIGRSTGSRALMTQENLEEFAVTGGGTIWFVWTSSTS